jgi:hypothetical protein
MIETFISIHLLDAQNAITIYHYAVLNNAAWLEAAAIDAIKYVPQQCCCAASRCHPRTHETHVCVRRNSMYTAWMKRNREALTTLNPSAHQVIFGSSG